MSTPPSNLPFEPPVNPSSGTSAPSPFSSNPPLPPSPPVVVSAPPEPAFVPPVAPRMTPPSVPPAPVVPPMSPSSSPSPAPRPVSPPEIKAMPPRSSSGREPEDMFSNIDPPAASPPKTAGAMAPLPTPSSGLAKYLFIGVGVVVLLSLVGFTFWYVAVRSPKVPVVAPIVPEVPVVQPTSSVQVIPAPEVPSAPSEPTPVPGSETSTTVPEGSSNLPTPVTTPPPGVNIPLPSAGATNTTPPSESAAVSVDTDQDGLFDQRETELGTNPSLADTDGDGLSDGDEVLKYGTNPLNPDTDGDTFKDGAEVSKGYSPLGPGKCVNTGCVR